MLRNVYTFFVLATLLLTTSAAAQSREIYVLTEPDWGEAEIILRFPLSLAYSDTSSPYLLIENHAGTIIEKVDQDAYESSYSGFVNFILKDYRFLANGVEIEPELGVLSLVNTANAPLRYEGYYGAVQLLSICTAEPGKYPISNMEVAILVYLPETTDQDTITLEFDASDKAPETRITDYRYGTPISIAHTGGSAVLPPKNGFMLWLKNWLPGS